MKKRRRPISSADPLQILATLVSQVQGNIDISRLCAGHVCRSCAGLLERCSSLCQKLNDNIKAAIPILPVHSGPEQSTASASFSARPSVSHDSSVPTTSNASPQVVAGFTLLHCSCTIIKIQAEYKRQQDSACSNF